jgi:uncharacterized OsmC-like protein
MRIVMNADNDLEFSHMLDPEMVVESRDPEAAYSALQMFATAIALCSFSMLYAYGSNLGVEAEDITLRVRWAYASHENRIIDIDLSVHWPGLPEARRDAAERAAALCTLHRTLESPPHVTTHLHV